LKRESVEQLELTASTLQRFNRRQAPSERIKQLADQHSFLFAQLGMHAKQYQTHKIEVAE
jgi:hypothetical protein